MKIASLSAALLAVSALLGHANANVTILDNDKTVEVDCAKDPEITLAGNHITVTATGVCAKITVTGNHATVTGSASAVDVLGNKNTVTLATADEILIAGNDNTVTVAKGAKRKAPRVSNTGTHNRVTQPK